MDIVNLQCWLVLPDEKILLKINCEVIFSFVFVLGENQMKHFSFVCFLGTSTTESVHTLVSVLRVKKLLVIFAKLNFFP